MLRANLERPASKAGLSVFINMNAALKITNQEVFAKVFPDAIKTFLYGAAVGVIILVSKISWWLGIILAGLYAILISIETIRIAVVTVLGMVVFPLESNSKITRPLLRRRSWIRISCIACSSNRNLNIIPLSLHSFSKHSLRSSAVPRLLFIPREFLESMYQLIC
jgi:hypothetical protein